MPLYDKRLNNSNNGTNDMYGMDEETYDISQKTLTYALISVLVLITLFYILSCILKKKNTR